MTIAVAATTKPSSSARRRRTLVRRDAAARAGTGLGVGAHDVSFASTEDSSCSKSASVPELCTT